nr:integrase, catalytic region, zinc finger, CCHC-type, peptidase aspartic, catalytic [Tanacetum cinerariifolium]GEZ16588.1 integrase, catalytic region, zinc finger, CCHC-type, peptidase aspartic, catalytic [Tanacetum cinerariifolium]
MTGNRSRLMNFVKKFIGTVRFGNDHFGDIMGYGDYVNSDSVISRVYYVEGLRRNLFSVGQLCDSDMEVAFRKHSCYVRDTDGVELIKRSRGSNFEDLGKLQTIVDIGIFVGYAPSRKDYNGNYSRLVPQTPSLTPNLPLTKNDWDTVFCPLFDEYFNPSPRVVSLVLAVVAAPRAVDLAGSPSSTIIDQDVLSASTSPTIQEIQYQVTHQGAEGQMHGHQNV